MSKLYLLIAVALFGSAFASQAQPAKALKRASVTLEQPISKPATGITANGFTANWEPVAGADGYCVYLYTKDVADRDGEHVIVEEGFEGITSGSIIEPAGGEDIYLELDDYCNSFGWAAYGYPFLIRSMVDGLVYSPYLNLTNADGVYKIYIDTYANNGDKIRVESHGAGEKVQREYFVSIPYGGSDITTQELEFDNGSRDLFFSIINLTAELGTPDYVDYVKVTQQLKQGDVIWTNIGADESLDATDDWGDPITSKYFSIPRFAYGATEIYYDVYAATYDWSTPNGSLPYTLVTSPYSKRVLVDLVNRTSEVIEDEHTGIATVTAQPATDDAWYDLAGRRVDNPERGIYIHNGKKIIR